MGKTLVSSAMIDRVVTIWAASWWKCRLGFKWFVDGLFDGSFGFGGEESAGAPSCASTARRGPPIKTASSCAAGGGDHRGDRETRRAITTNWRNAPERRATTVCRLPRPPRKRRWPSSRKWSALTPRRDPITARRGRGAGQRGGVDCGPQGDDRQRRFAARPSGHRRRLQDLLRKLPRRRASQAD